MEGADANPEQNRGLIRNFPMFTYPKKQTVEQETNHGIKEKEDSLPVDKA